MRNVSSKHLYFKKQMFSEKCSFLHFRRKIMRNLSGKQFYPNNTNSVPITNFITAPNYAIRMCESQQYVRYLKLKKILSDIIGV